MADFKYTVKFGGDFTQLQNQAQTVLKNIQSSFKGNTSQEVTQMLDQVKQIQSKLPDLAKKANEPFTSKKSYDKFISESREVLKTVESLQKAFNNMGQHSQGWKMDKMLSPADLQNFNTLSSILKEIQNFKMPDLSMKKTLEDNVTRAKKAQSDLKTSARTQELTSARDTFANRKADAGDLYKSSYDNLGAEKYVAALEKERDKLRETKEKQAALKQQIEEATKQQADIAAAEKRLEEALNKQKGVSENPNSTKKQQKTADYWVKTRQQELDQAKANNTTQMPTGNITPLTDEQLNDLESKVTRLEQLIQRQNTAIANAQKNGVKPNARAIDSALSSDKAAADQDYTKAEAELKQFLGVVAQAQAALDNLRKQVADLYQAMGLQPPMDFKTASAQELSNTLTNLSNTVRGDVNNSFNTMNNDVNTLGKSMGDLKQKTEEETDAVDKHDKTIKNVSAIESRIAYFFSWYNAINLVRRGISSAVSSIKELDAAMTETAIVTNFSVSDMWERLPEYTQHANELGVSVKGMYEAATLYYQQGLATNQAMELSVETMKMARIAGLEASEATDRMTNALRAFNMELNDTSAQRVNDVYSKIAAISASNVDELSTAMTKVASLAANVGMTFEQTTAYLATGIETTRESADSIGTALKTVLARFAEMKKDPSMMEAVDGEMVDVNKVDTALRSIGIMLKDNNGQIRAMGDVFEELNEVWGDLDVNTQRYIATMAAGSRQQSRFIAMMGDAARTAELYEAAVNSNGASQQQFEKTLESLETKLQKLKNAWQEFLMGIANSDMVKGIVDALTTFLTTLNKILTAVSGNGIGRSISSILVLFSAFSVGNKFFADGTKLLGRFLGEAATAPKKFNVLGNSWTAFTQMLTARSITDTGAGLQLMQEAAQGAGGAIGGMATKVGALLPGLGLIALKIAAIVAIAWVVIKVIKAIAKAIHDASFEGQLENIQKGVKDVEDELNKVNNQIEDLGQHQQTFENLKKQLSEMVAGSDEWKAKLQEINQEAINIASTYKNAKLVSNGGMLEVTNLDEIKKDAEELQKILIDNQKILLASEKRAEQNVSIESAFKSGQDILGQLPGRTGVGYYTQDKFTSYIKKIAQDDNIPVVTSDILFEELSPYTSEGMEQIFKENLETYGDEFIQKINELIQEIRNGDSQIESLIDSFGDEEGEETVASILAKEKVNGFDEEQLAKEISKAVYGLENSYADGKYAKMLGGEGSKQDYEDLLKALQNKGLFKDAAVYVDSDTNKNQVKLSNGEVIAASQLMAAMAKEVEQDRYDNAKDYYARFNNDKTLERILKRDKTLDPEVLKEYLGKFSENSVIGKTIQKAIDNITQSQLGMRSNIITSMTGIATLDQINALVPIIKNLGWNKVQSINKDIMVGGNTKESNQAYWAAINSGSKGDLFNVFDTKEYEEFSKALENLDFSTPIAGATTIRKLLNSDNELLREFGETYKKVGRNSIGFSKQVNQLLDEEQYKELNKSFAKALKKQGEITGSDIKSLAGSYEDLQEVLDNTGLSASKFATILTNVEKGTINLNNITEPMLEAFSKVKNIEEYIDEVKAFSDNFKEGADTGEPIDWFSGISKSMEEFADNDEFGNTKFQKYMEAVLDPEDYKKIFQQNGKEIEKSLKAEEERIRKLTLGDGWGFIQSLATGDQDKNSALKQYSATLNKAGDIAIDFGKMTSEQVIANIQEVYGISEQLATALFTNLMGHSVEMQQSINKNDMIEALSVMIQGMLDLDHAAVVSQTQLETMAKAYGQDIEYINELFDDLTKDINKVARIDWAKVDTSSIESAAKTFEDILRNSNTELNVFDFITLTDKGNVDFQKSLDNLVGAGMSEEMATAVLEGGLDGAQKLAAIVETYEYDPRTGKIEKKEEEIAEKTAADLQDAIELATQQADYSILANALFNAAFTSLSNAINQVLASGDGKLWGGIVNVVGKIGSIKIGSGGKEGTITGNAAIKQNQTSAQTNTKSSTQRDNSNAAKAERVVNSWNESTQDYWYNKLSSGNYINTGTNEEKAYKQALLKELEAVYGKAQTKANITSRAENNKVQVADKSVSASQENKDMAAGGTYNTSKNSKDQKDTTDRLVSDYEWLYNLNHKISEEIHKQTIYEGKLQQLSYSLANNSKESLGYFQQQLGSMEQQIKYQEELYEKAKQRLELERNLLLSKSIDYTDSAGNTSKTTYGEIFAKSGHKYSDFSWVDKNGTAQYNWDLINSAISNGDYGSEINTAIKELISINEKYESDSRSAQENIVQIKNKVEDIKKQNRSTMNSFVDRVAQAYKALDEESLQKLEDIHNALTEINENIVDAMEKNVSALRQDLTNQNVQDKLDKATRRLAYLQQDTTGANQGAILALQKQLKEDTQSYRDSLVDQAISKLQDQNEAAANQRQVEIDLMQSQIDHNEKWGVYSSRAWDAIMDAFNGDGSFSIEDSELYSVLYHGEGWYGKVQTQIDENLLAVKESMTATQQYLWQDADYAAKNLDVTSEILSWLKGNLGGDAKDAHGNSFKMASETAYQNKNYDTEDGWNQDANTGKWWYEQNGKYLAEGWAKIAEKWYYFDKDGWMLEDTKTPDGYTVDASGAWIGDYPEYTDALSSSGAIATSINNLNSTTALDGKETRDIVTSLSEDAKKQLESRLLEVKNQVENGTISEQQGVNEINNVLSTYGVSIQSSLETLDQDLIEAINGIDLNVQNNVTVTSGPGGSSSSSSGSSSSRGYTSGSYSEYVNSSGTRVILAGNASKYKAYATGGLNDTPGFHWLDGTPGKPELVLNPQDTQNFIELKDTLRQLQNAGVFLGGNSSTGNYMFDVDINGVALENDYDVEQLAERVEKEIVSAMNYRNINSINARR